LEFYKDPAELYREACRRYRAWDKLRRGIDGGSKILTNDELEDVKEEDISETEFEDVSETGLSVFYELAKEQAQEIVDNFLHAMEAYEFQRLVADLLEAIGYHVNWIAPPGKDGGVDILAFTDPLGTHGPRIKVQVKQQKNTVSEPVLKSFIANLGPLDSGICVCSGGFTKDAITYARIQESRRIMLIDSIKLVQLWTENSSKLSDQAKRRFPLSPIYFLTPDD
jgi:restriction system protein